MHTSLSGFRLVVALLAVAFASGGCAWLRDPHATARQMLAAEIGRDPVVALQEVCDPESRREAHNAQGEELTADQTLRLVRWGLADEDEQAVFGAVLLMGDQLALPELRHAAAVVIPRLGQPDCPVTSDDAAPLIGSVDFEALIEVIPRLPEEEALVFLGQLHRMVRPDSIPALCELALATTGKVRDAAFGNACLTAAYSQQGVPLLLRTSLQMAGLPEAVDLPGSGLPNLLRTVLQAALDLPDLYFPALCCARLLLDSQPTVVDLPLLQGLLSSPNGDLRNAVAWTLGSMTDEQSHRLLLEERPDKVVSVCWLAARARRGDAALLEQLLAGEYGERIYGLAAASPARRREFVADLLAMPADQSVPIVKELGDWPRGRIFESIADPMYGEQWLPGLETMAAATKNLDVKVLRALVANMPCCETVRFAGALLAAPADALFAAHDGAPHELHSLAFPYLGHHSVWAFLEVTRPEAFRSRLLEGFDSDVSGVRDLCAELLMRLGDTQRLDDLAQWIDNRTRYLRFDGWMFLARDRSPEVRELLRRRVAGPDVDEEELRALAVALGMPFEFAERWNLRDDGVAAAAREALLAGDAAQAFLVTSDGFHGWNWPVLLTWQQPRVTQLLLEQRRSADVGMPELFHFDQLRALATGDRAQIARMLEPIRDGRYAAHGNFSVRLAARANGLEMLPFWIEQLGSNCCKCVLVEEVLEDLFRYDSEAFHRCGRREPASVYLRRTLLPVADRLRWSRIANGYVVAGR